MYIFFVPPKHPSNTTLGSLILVWTVTVFVYVFKSDEFFIQYPHLYSLIDPIVLLFFPLMFFYIKFYFTPSSKIDYKLVFHFLPVLLYFVAFSPFLILSSNEKVEHLTNELPDWFLPYSLFFDSIIIVQGVIYSLKSAKILYQFHDTSSLSKDFRWSIRFMKYFVFSNIFLWALGTAAVVLQIMNVKVPVNFFHFFYFGLTCLMLTIGFCAFKWPKLFLHLATIELEEIKSDKSEEEFLHKTDEVLNEESQRLLALIEEKKPYLQNDLKMQDLADISDFSYKKISQLLNNELNTSFYELMNDFRLKEVLKLIEEGKHIQFNLPHLGEQAGFNSKTTFNRIFKQKIGQTPSEYIKSLEQ
ncbi:helix-turn-helix transcriptional regulator [Flammeovirga aprica]|uniref:Helix-turn-helix domain-containing protein n=1 Tax=Flammeovirga aprica JL-4 TaxID=694437 RepID=A0A7X9RSC9_9BACT|nr:helix-turn-helix domain-containing protein [Flammeovirga aprica]NME67065.1 helix-turn-helix domain-containing protein [Flammeovirga aprica JL-4]